MGEADQERDEIADLRERVRRLEGLYSLIDLLGLPGLLAGGAARIFDTLQKADQIGDQTAGFYPLERTADGVHLRWTRFPNPAQLPIPVLQGYPFRVELSVLRMPHIRSGEDLVFEIDELGPITLRESDDADPGAALFVGAFMSDKSGLMTASLTSRTYLESAGADQRRLGVPLVSLRTFPSLYGSDGA